MCAPSDRYAYDSSLVSFYCEDDEFNQLASLMISPSEDAIKQLFHAPSSMVFEGGLLALFFLV